MGRHSSQDRRRRPAAWLVVAAVVVVLVAGLTVAYLIVVNRDRNTAACSGSTVLPVTASPGAATAVNAAAAAFNSTAPVARSTCVSVSVTSIAGAAAATALAGGWTNQKVPAPGLWVVDSAADVASLDGTNSAMTAGHTNASLATSPVVLALRKPLPAGARNWQSVAEGTDGLVVAIPDPAANRASGYALESVVAASARAGQAGGIDAATVTGAAPTLLALARAVPTPPPTTQAALAELAAGTSRYSAVPVVESELAAFNAANSSGLTGLYPSGGTAGDDILAVPLTAPWVTAAMSDAAAAFDAFLGDRKGLAILAKRNLRSGVTAETSPGVDLTTKVTPLPDATDAVRSALNTQWAAARTAVPANTATSTATATGTTMGTTTSGTETTTTTVASVTTTTPTTTTPTIATGTAPPSTAGVQPPVAGTTSSRTSREPPPQPAITLVLDASRSMSIVQRGQRRISATASAVTADVLQSPTAMFGLWTFSTDEATVGYLQRVPLGPLTDSVDAGTRATALTTTINGLTPGGDRWLYAAIQAAYTDAALSAVAGRTNRVVVLTDGGDSTPGLSRNLLKAQVAALAARTSSVTLNIIGLSSDVDTAALTEIAGAGGGSFIPVYDLADLQSTLLTLFTP